MNVISVIVGSTREGRFSETQVPDSEHLAIIEMRGERIFKMRNFRNLHDAQL